MITPPRMPTGREVVLPRRGRTWVYDSAWTGDGPVAAPGGPPLLLLHGWTSTAAQNWNRCVPALAERYRVIALDQRGHGRGIRSRRPFRLEDCADDAAALLDTLEVGAATVAGYSMGGPVAQLMWQRRADVVDGLVLCATAARFAVRQQFRGPIGTAGMGASMGMALLPTAARRRAMHYLTRNWGSTGAVADWALEEWRLHDPSALLQAGLALSRFDSTPWIGDIDVPTAVVVTEKDTTVSPRRQHYLADHIPGAQTFLVAGDHRACVDARAVFVPALIEACESVRAPAGTKSQAGAAGGPARPAGM